jgi:benzoyl-CoA reductase subunit D
MIAAGIDIGSDYTQAAILEDEELVSYGETRTGFDLDEAGERAIADALDGADGLERDDIEVVVATGEARKSVDVDQRVTSYTVIGLMLSREWPSARSVLMMGAKNAAALKLDGDGMVLDFDENDKCAAGVGRFLSDLTRYLDMELEEMIEATLGVDEGVEGLNTQCSVFAESEVISLIHENVSPAHIARGVHDAIAERNSSLLRRVGVEEDVLVIGGVGRNVAFVQAVEDIIGVPVQTPGYPAHVAAHGAALSAVVDDAEQLEQDIEVGSKQTERFAESIE